MGLSHPWKSPDISFPICRHVDLNFNQMTPEATLEVATLIASKPTITHVDLAANCIDSDLLVFIVEQLVKLPNLARISFNGDRLGPRRAVLIADLLSAHSTIRSIDMTQNDLVPEATARVF